MNMLYLQKSINFDILKVAIECSEYFFKRKLGLVVGAMQLRNNKHSLDMRMLARDLFLADYTKNYLLICYLKYSSAYSSSGFFFSI